MLSVSVLSKLKRFKEFINGLLGGSIDSGGFAGIEDDTHGRCESVLLLSFSSNAYVDDVHFKIVVSTLDGVLRLVMEVELKNLELGGSLKNVLGIGRLEIHTRVDSLVLVLVDLNGGVRSNPLSWSLVEVTILVSANIVGNFDLSEGVLQINRRLLVLSALPFVGRGGQLCPVGTLLEVVEGGSSCGNGTRQ